MAKVSFSYSVCFEVYSGKSSRLKQVCDLNGKEKIIEIAFRLLILDRMNCFLNLNAVRYTLKFSRVNTLIVKCNPLTKQQAGILSTAKISNLLHCTC